MLVRRGRRLVTAVMLLIALTVFIGFIGLISAGTILAQQSQDQPYLGARVVVNAQGTQITSITPDSPADAAGLRVGDVIVAVGGEKVTESDPLDTILGKYRSGMRVMLSIRRGTLLLDRPVTFGSQPAPTDTLAATTTTQVAAVPTDTPTAAMTSTPVPTSPYFQTVMAIVMTNAYINTAISHTQTATAWTLTPSPTSPFTATSVFTSTPTPRPTQVGVAPQPAIPPQAGRLQLGVEYEDVTPELAVQRNLAVKYGALIDRVYPGSPADIAGIQVGDVITEVDGDRVDARRNLAYRLIPYRPGDSLTLTIARGTDTLTLSVTLSSHGVALLTEN